MISSPLKGQHKWLLSLLEEDTLTWRRHTLAIRLPRWRGGNKSTANAGDTRDTDSIPGTGRSPGGGNGNPHQYFLPGKLHGQRILVGYRPWCHKESDMTEHTYAHSYVISEIMEWLCKNWKHLTSNYGSRLQLAFLNGIQHL